jgi:hypothetical protein
VPLMEDVEFFRRLHRHGRVVHSKKRIVASPRRYEAIGPTRLTLAYGFIATLYIFGVPSSRLASIYERMCSRHNSGSPVHDLQYRATHATATPDPKRVWRRKERRRP